MTKINTTLYVGYRVGPCLQACLSHIM